MFVRSHYHQIKSGYWKPCFSRTNNLCCKQVLLAATFKSNATLKAYQIFHQLYCKSSHIIYLLQCLKCQIQYVGKPEIKFSITLNNRRKDIHSHLYLKNKLIKQIWTN